jgi:lipid-binding SYLF domain-containing protein
MQDKSSWWRGGGDCGTGGTPRRSGNRLEARPQFLTCSQAKGLFAGFDLGGSWVVERDEDSTITPYGKDLTNHAILDEEVPAPTASRPVLEVRRAQASGEQLVAPSSRRRLAKKEMSEWRKV